MIVASKSEKREDRVRTIRAAYSWAQRQLTESPTPAVDARLLLEKLLGVGHVYLVSHDEELLTPAQWAEYQAMVARARQEEPIPYIIGHVDFYGRKFSVGPAVLIPRPETEELVQLALSWARVRPDCHVVDVGTGSGCIAITLACELPAARIMAVDISATALAVARENASRHVVVAQLHFVQGDLLAPLAADCDLIVANLPYISDVEWTAVADGVKSYEPASALRGGPDGLLFIRQLLLQAAAGHLRSQGAVLLEIGWQHGQAALHLAEAIFPQAQVMLLKDLAGQDRIIQIQT